MEKAFEGMQYEVIGEGIPVLLIHGFAEDREYWRPLVEDMRLRHRLILVDLPGFGKSPAAELDLAELGNLMSRLLHHEGLNRAFVFGHSLGGYIALELLSQAEYKLLGLGLVNTHCFADNPDKIAIREKTVRLLEQGQKEQILRLLHKDLYNPTFREKESSRFEQILKRSLETPADVLIHYYRAMMRRRPRVEALQTARVPVFVLAGALDPTVPKQRSLEMMNLPDISDVHLLPDCSHMNIQEAPDISKTLIMNYIDQNRVFNLS